MTVAQTLGIAQLKIIEGEHKIENKKAEARDTMLLLAEIARELASNPKLQHLRDALKEHRAPVTVNGFRIEYDHLIPINFGQPRSTPGIKISTGEHRTIRYIGVAYPEDPDMYPELEGQAGLIGLSINPFMFESETLTNDGYIKPPQDKPLYGFTWGQVGQINEARQMLTLEALEQEFGNQLAQQLYPEP